MFVAIGGAPAPTGVAATAGPAQPSLTLNPTSGPPGTQVQILGACGSDNGVDWNNDGVPFPDAAVPLGPNFASVYSSSLSTYLQGFLLWGGFANPPDPWSPQPPGGGGALAIPADTPPGVYPVQASCFVKNHPREGSGFAAVWVFIELFTVTDVEDDDSATNWWWYIMTTTDQLGSSVFTSLLATGLRSPPEVEGPLPSTTTTAPSATTAPTTTTTSTTTSTTSTTRPAPTTTR